MQHRRVVAALMLVVASPLVSQSPEYVTRTDSTVRLRSSSPGVSRATVVTVNPLAAFALHFTGDVERRVSQAVSIGVGATASAIDDYNDYRALDFKVRYYPAERVLQGFALAATIGLGTTNGGVNYDFLVLPNGEVRDVRFTKPGRITRPLIGTELSYQWLLGPSRRFVTVLGLGVKRRLGSEGPADPLSIPLLPTARVNIGVAF
jgi:hypothetical protein